MCNTVDIMWSRLADAGVCPVRHLRDHARTIAGKAQQFTTAYAKALEVRLLSSIPACRASMLVQRYGNSRQPQ